MKPDPKNPERNAAMLRIFEVIAMVYTPEYWLTVTKTMKCMGRTHEDAIKQARKLMRRAGWTAKDGKIFYHAKIKGQTQ